MFNTAALNYTMSMTVEDKLGLRVRILRDRRGWSQPALAERIDRSIDMISKIETGASAPSFETLKRLSRELDVPLKDLFDFEGAGNDAKRLELLTEISDIVRHLKTKDLAHAADLMATFEKHIAESR